MYRRTSHANTELRTGPRSTPSNFAYNLALPGLVLGLGVSVPINGLFCANASSDLKVYSKWKVPFLRQMGPLTNKVG